MSATKLINPSSFIRVPMVEEEDKTCHTCKKEYEVEDGRGGYEGHKCFECFNFEETDCLCGNNINKGWRNPEEEELICRDMICEDCDIGGINQMIDEDDLEEEEYEQRLETLGEKPGDDYHVCDNLIHGDCPDGSVWHSDNVLKYNHEDLCLCPKCFFGDERKDGGEEIDWKQEFMEMKKHYDEMTDRYIKSEKENQELKRKLSLP